MRFIRLPLVILALVVCAWFVLGIREAHDVNAATAIVDQNPPVSAAQDRQAASALHDAGVLNPDGEVDVLRAQLDVRVGRYSAAMTAARRATAHEPGNVLAWLTLASASYDAGRLDQHAVARMIELDPELKHTKL